MPRFHNKLHSEYHHGNGLDSISPYYNDFMIDGDLIVNDSHTFTIDSIGTISTEDLLPIGSNITVSSFTIDGNIDYTSFGITGVDLVDMHDVELHNVQNGDIFTYYNGIWSNSDTVNLPYATASTNGVIEMATDAEVIAGTSTVKGITPQQVTLIDDSTNIRFKTIKLDGYYNESDALYYPIDTTHPIIADGTYSIWKRFYRGLFNSNDPDFNTDDIRYIIVEMTVVDDGTLYSYGNRIEIRYAQYVGGRYTNMLASGNVVLGGPTGHPANVVKRQMVFPLDSNTDNFDIRLSGTYNGSLSEYTRVRLVGVRQIVR